MQTVAVADLPKFETAAVVEKVEPVPSGFQVTLAVTVECDARPKPAYVAQVLYRFFGPTGPAARPS